MPCDRLRDPGLTVLYSGEANNMKSIASNGARLVPVVEDPPECDPIELYRKVQIAFGWGFEEFSICFGWEVNTIQRWYYGQKSSRKARILAAILQEKWGLD